MAKGFGKQPGKKTKAQVEAERDHVTVYVNEHGVEWRAETHAACKGRGCAECGWLGFIKLSQGDIFHA